jgi:transposase InsO family protein
VSDTTYFRFFIKWNYLCPILDLSDRYVVGCSVSNKRDARLAWKAFHSIKGDLRKIGMFHSDRGSEFNNELIDDLLSGFSIKRSFSNKGNPYDNAVIEAFNNTRLLA